ADPGGPVLATLRAEAGGLPEQRPRRPAVAHAAALCADDRRRAGLRGRSAACGRRCSHGLIQLRRKKGRVLFAGQSYYHAWYLSRELRKLRSRVPLVDGAPNPASDLYYHGEDYRLRYRGRRYWRGRT